MERICPANDNSPNPAPLPRWAVYRAASRAKWIGQVVARSADEAIEAAAIVFNTNAKKLIAVRQVEIEDGAVQR
jgi:hypothetical protein